MINLKITSTVSSFLNEKTLEGFHPVRGMVLERPLPVEELTPADLDLLMCQDTKNKEWIPRPALVDMERVLRLAKGHPHAVYGESQVSPQLIHWTVGEAQLLVSFGSVVVPQRATAMNVVMLLGNQEAHRLIQQTAVELRAMIPLGASRTKATLPSGYGTDTLSLDYARQGQTFETHCNLYLDADAEPSAERLQDYLELMHSVELNIDTPQEKLGWTKSLTKPGQMLVAVGQGLPVFFYEPGETMSWEVRKILHAKSVERTRRLMSLLFGCEFKL
jgi:hypothetical protein